MNKFDSKLLYISVAKMMIIICMLEQQSFVDSQIQQITNLSIFSNNKSSLLQSSTNGSGDIILKDELKEEKKKIQLFKTKIKEMKKKQQQFEKKMQGYVNFLEEQIREKEAKNIQTKQTLKKLKEELEESRDDLGILTIYLEKKRITFTESQKGAKKGETVINKQKPGYCTPKSQHCNIISPSSRVTLKSNSPRQAPKSFSPNQISLASFKKKANHCPK